MIIQHHDIQLDSSRVFTENHQKEEHLEVWDNNSRLEITNSEGSRSAEFNINTSRNEAFRLDLSTEAMKKFERSKAKQTALEPAGDDDNLPPALAMAKILLEKFFGIKVEIIKPGDEAAKEAHGNHPEPAGGTNQPGNQVENQPENQPANQPQPQGWGIRYSYHEIHHEKETVNFSAGGTVSTEDGREINFDMKMQMSREKLEETHIEFRAGDALIDPLALNMDGQGVQLTGEKFEFDLDADGNKENISFLKQGSGFLALDKNQNGTVDDGSELFGPATNNGFLELKAYDQDQNNWIDEKDAIFYDLKLWTKNEDGSDQLSSLDNYDIGAIYLDSVQTKMEMDEGQLRESGIYLKENGQVNAIQEVDLRTSGVIA